MNRWSSLFLALMLLLAQAALLEHQYDFAAHKSGDSCVTCLHATPLSHTMSGTLALDIQIERVPFEFLSVDVVTPRSAAVVYHARAPPAVTFT